MTCDRELVTEGVDARIARSQVGPDDAGQDDPVILVGMPQRANKTGARESDLTLSLQGRRRHPSNE